VTSVLVRIPSPLRSYTDGAKEVEASGVTLGDVIDDLDRRFPGIRFRVVDEQHQLRRHMNLFVNDRRERDLSTPLEATDVVTVMQALSGG
jgi:molybdopterin converting factor small subunit